MKPYEIVPPIDGELTGVCCSVCQDEERSFSFDPVLGDVAVKTCCGHFFHRACLDEWLRQAFTEKSSANGCPVCKEKIQVTVPKE